MNNNWPYPFFNNQSMMPYDINQKINNLENRIYNLEKEIEKLKHITLTDKNNNNYSIGYKPNSYNMM